MYIHAFDPGASTGFVVLKTSPRLELVAARVLKTFADFDYWGSTTWIKYLPDAIVIEDFHLYPHMAAKQIGSGFPSVKFIGVIQYIAYTHSLSHAVTMQPASCKEPFDKDHWDETLGILPQLKDVSSQHICDAAMHALYFYFNTKGVKVP